MSSTIVPADGEDGVVRMPLNSSGGDGPGEFILVLLTTLVEEMDFVGGGDGNGGVDRDIGDCNPDDLLVIALELSDFGL